MITFSRLGEFGRLGNQLFQYAMLYVLGKEKEYEIKIPDFQNKYHHGQKCLLDNFNITAEKLTVTDVIEYMYIEQSSDYFKYHILAMGSTLSWWVGFLNKQKENKIIIAPQKYHIIKDVDVGFYPDNFIVI